MFGTLPPASPPRLTCTTLCRVCTLRGTAAVVFADVCMCRLQGLWRVMHPGACSSVEHLQREGAYKYELTYRVWFIHTGFSQSCSVEWRELETGSERGVHGISIPLCIGGTLLRAPAELTTLWSAGLTPKVNHFNGECFWLAAAGWQSVLLTQG